MSMMIVIVEWGENSETQRHQHKQNEIFYTFFSKKNDLISEWGEKIGARKELIFNPLHSGDLCGYRETTLKMDQRKPENLHEEKWNVVDSIGKSRLNIGESWKAT